MTDSNFRSVPGQSGKTSAPTMVDDSPSPFPRSARPGESPVLLPFAPVKKSGQSRVLAPGLSHSGRIGRMTLRPSEDLPRD